MNDMSALFPAGHRYELLEMIGQGGQAEVWRAHDRKFGVNRAVKILRVAPARNIGMLRRFEQEAKLMARLEHPHIVRVLEVGSVKHPDFTDPRDDKKRKKLRRPLRIPFLVMEYLDGGSVTDVVKQDGPISPRIARKITVSLLKALLYAHQNDVVHRDVKPGNVMIDRHGIYKLGDFGIAHLDDSPHTHTKTGIHFGSLPFMAPEQYKDAKSADARADLYAVGVTMWSILVAEDPPASFYAVRELRADMMLGMIQESLRDIIVKATQERPEDRYQSADEMIDALEAVGALNDSPVIEVREIPPPEGQILVPLPAAANASDIGGLAVSVEQPRPALVEARTDYGEEQHPPGFTELPAPGSYGSEGTILPGEEEFLPDPAAARRKLVMLLGGVLTLCAFGILAIFFLANREGQDSAPAPVVQKAPKPALVEEEPLLAENVGAIHESPSEETARTVEEIYEAPVPTPPAPKAETSKEPDVGGGSPAPETKEPEPEIEKPVGARHAVPSELEPEPEPAPEPTHATLTLSGDVPEVWLMNAAGTRFAIGDVPPGAYQIKAVFQGNESVAGQADLAAGQTVEIRCSKKFKSCKPKAQ